MAKYPNYRLEGESLTIQFSEQRGSGKFILGRLISFGGEIKVEADDPEFEDVAANLKKTYSRETTYGGKSWDDGKEFLQELPDMFDKPYLFAEEI